MLLELRAVHRAVAVACDSEGARDGKARALWSPVTITTRMPAFTTLCHRIAHFVAGGSISPTMPSSTARPEN